MARWRMGKAYHLSLTSYDASTRTHTHPIHQHSNSTFSLWYASTTTTRENQMTGIALSSTRSRNMYSDQINAELKQWADMLAAPNVCVFDASAHKTQRTAHCMYKAMVSEPRPRSTMARRMEQQRIRHNSFRTSQLDWILCAENMRNTNKYG